MPNRALIFLATGALTVVPSLGALATTASASEVPAPPSSTTTSTTSDSSTSTDTTTTTPPPPGHAEGYALLVDPLLAIGHSSADATSTGGSATGNAVELGGAPLIDGTTGGTQKGAGKKNGALLDTGVTPLGQLQLTPWSAAVTSTSAGSTADGDAALLRLFLVDPTVLRAAVLQSTSHAEYNSTVEQEQQRRRGREPRRRRPRRARAARRVLEQRGRQLVPARHQRQPDRHERRRERQLHAVRPVGHQPLLPDRHRRPGRPRRGCRPGGGRPGDPG